MEIPALSIYEQGNEVEETQMDPAKVWTTFSSLISFDLIFLGIYLYQMSLYGFFGLFHDYIFYIDFSSTQCLIFLKEHNNFDSVYNGKIKTQENFHV